MILHDITCKEFGDFFSLWYWSMLNHIEPSILMAIVSSSIHRNYLNLRLPLVSLVEWDGPPSCTMQRGLLHLGFKRRFLRWESNLDLFDFV